jgi:hypothetical protein
VAVQSTRDTTERHNSEFTGFTLRKLDPLPSSGEETATPTLLGPLETPKLSQSWCQAPIWDLEQFVKPFLHSCGFVDDGSPL